MITEFGSSPCTMFESVDARHKVQPRRVILPHTQEPKRAQARKKRVNKLARAGMPFRARAD